MGIITPLGIQACQDYTPMRMSIHLSIKAKLVVSAQARKELKSTMEEFNRACNTLSDLAFQQDLHRKYDIHHAGYRLIREETNLPSQHVINAIAKVSAVYSRESSKLHQFKPYSSVRFDARTMVLGQACDTASLTICPKGRLTGRLQMSAKMRKQLRQGELGSAELVYRQRSFYLHLSITIPAPKISEPSGSLGVDLGVKRLAVTSNKKFHSAKKIRHKKACYKRTRKSLQANGSKGAKRALKRVSGRERRFVADTNHCVSKQIVADAKLNNQRIVLEDLNGVRKTGKAKCVHDWSFAELQQMISYKAAKAGLEVVLVEAHYTSQTCSRCLHLGVRANQSKFQCPDCGLQINADLNGARSIAIRHDLVAMGRYFCEYPRKEVNRPEAVRPSAKRRQVRNLKPQAPSPARSRA
ncbi:MAG: RNA-guided endonuclease TnpB family protein [Acidobacteria bacterium]|nr:RNA-guided endonuclease TnpB family protein [Acidobacteriota bacterium]